MRKALFSVLAAVIVMAGASIWEGSVAAAELKPSEVQSPKGTKEDDGHVHHKGHMKHKDFEAYRLEKLKEIAVYFGISTDGKSAEQLKKEVTAAKEANKEKWEAFKAEYKEKRLQHLQKTAKEHGIKIKGKSAEQLREELHKLHGHHGKHQHKTKEQ